MTVLVSFLMNTHNLIYPSLAKIISRRKDQGKITGWLETSKSLAGITIAVAIAQLQIFTSPGAAIFTISAMIVIYATSTIIKNKPKKVSLWSCSAKINRNRCSDLHTNLWPISILGAVYNGAYIILNTLTPLLMYDKYNAGLSGAAMIPVISASSLMAGLMVAAVIANRIKLSRWIPYSVIASCALSLFAINSGDYLSCLALLGASGFFTGLWNVTALAYMNNLSGDKNTKIKKYVFIVKSASSLYFALFVVLGFYIDQTTLASIAISFSIIVATWLQATDRLHKAECINPSSG